MLGFSWCPIWEADATGIAYFAGEINEHSLFFTTLQPLLLQGCKKRLNKTKRQANRRNA